MDIPSVFLDDDIEIELMEEIYSLESMHHDLVVENVRTNHAFKSIGNIDIITEGTNNTIKKIADFFKQMIEKIKEFFNKVFMYINSCFMDIDKFVKKYDKELKSLKFDKFEIYGYKFTLHDAPDMSEFESIVNDYNADLAEAGKMKKSEIIAKQNEYVKDSNLDKIRGKVLGTNNAISSEDFHEEVRKYYRDGELDDQPISISNEEFRSIIADVDSLMKGKKEAEKTRDKLIVLLDKTQKFFDKKASVIYVNNQKSIKTNRINTSDNEFKKGDDEYVKYSESAIGSIDAFIRFKYNQVNKIASIINLVASERANAYKDQVKQTRKIIKAALGAKDEDKEEK